MIIKKLIITLSVGFMFSLTTAVSGESVVNEVKNDAITKVNEENIKTTVTLTFNPDGGTLYGEKVLVVTKGAAYSTFKDNTPYVYREGAGFSLAWTYLKDGKATEVTDDTTFTADTELTAYWRKYTVTFDCGDGHFSSGGKTYTIPDPTTCVHSDDLKDTPVLAHHAFECWTLDDEPITFPFMPLDLEKTNITLKAKYTTDYVTIALNAGSEGEFADGKKSKFIDVAYGSNSDQVITADCKPTYTGSEGKHFVIYLDNTKTSEEEKRIVDYTFNKSMVITAHYAVGNKITLNARANGGKWADGTNKDKAFDNFPSTGTFADFKKLHSITDDMTTYTSGKTTYTQQGWYYDRYGVNKVNDGDYLNKDMNLYAFYDKDFKITHSGKNYKISGPTTFKKSAITDAGLSFTITPNTGYHFTNYTLTVKTGGVKLLDSKHYTFTYDPSNPTKAGTLKINKSAIIGDNISIEFTLTKVKYNVHLPEKLSEGVSKVETSMTNPTYQDEVTIYAIAKEGYHISNISVEGTKISSSSNTLKFKMPANDVNITVSASKSQFKITLPTEKPTGLQWVKASSETPSYQEEVNVNTYCDPGYMVTYLAVKDDNGSIYKECHNEPNMQFLMPGYNLTVYVEVGVFSPTVTFTTLDDKGIARGVPERMIKKVVYNTPVDKPETPAAIEENDHFAGWYTTSACKEGEEYDFTKPVTSDMTIYARFLTGDPTIITEEPIFNIDPEVDPQVQFRLKIGDTIIKDEMVWSTTDSSVATIDNNGLMTPVGAGSCEITVDYNYSFATYSNFEIGSFSKLNSSKLKSGRILNKSEDIEGEVLVPSRYYISDYEGWKTLRFNNDDEFLSILRDGAFYKCKNITSVDVAKGLTVLGVSAFEECTSLKQINLREGLKTICRYCFYNCSALEGITIPSTVTKIGVSDIHKCDAFAGCSNMTLVVVNSPTIAKVKNHGNIYDPLKDGKKKTVKVPEGTKVESMLSEKYTLTTTEGGYDVYVQND